MRQRGALVNGAALLDELLHDCASALSADRDTLLNLTVAASESGYSADYLGRLVKDGTIPNAGRPGAPRIRRGDLPRKAGNLRPSPNRGDLLVASPGQIARAVVTSHVGVGR